MDKLSRRERRAAARAAVCRARVAKWRLRLPPPQATQLRESGGMTTGHTAPPLGTMTRRQRPMPAGAQSCYCVAARRAVGRGAQAGWWGELQGCGLFCPPLRIPSPRLRCPHQRRPPLASRLINTDCTRDRGTLWGGSRACTRPCIPSPSPCPSPCPCLPPPSPSHGLGRRSRGGWCVSRRP